MNAFIRLLCIVSLGLTAGACATIANGTTQAINIDSDPAGADCTLMRAGQPISAVTTPAPVTVKRDQQTIHVRCKKDGYEEALVVMNSRYEMASAGNILLGGVIGMMVDNSSGANAKYDPYVMVRMTALSPADQAAAAARPKVALVAPAPPAMPSEAYHPGVPASGATPYDGTYEGNVDVLQVDVSPPVPRRRDFVVEVRNGIVTGTVKHPLCDRPGEVFLVIDSSGAIKGKADTQNTIGCSERMTMVEGRMDGTDMRLMLGVRSNPVLLLKRVRTSTSVRAAAPARPAGPLDGDYAGGVEMGQGNLRRLWIRVEGSKATGTSRAALCPTPGTVSLSIDPSGAISGDADLQTSTTCYPRRVALVGHVEGKRLLVTANLDDGSKPQDFVFQRQSRGAGVDD